MLRHSHLRLQFGSKNTYANSGIKKQFADHYRDISADADRPQRPLPPHKLPQLVHINKKCPPGLGGTAIEADSDTSYSFDGYRLIGAAFRAHKKVFMRKQNKNTTAKNDDEFSDDGTEFLFHDQHCLVVPDAFPKSTFHFLIMPRMSKYPHLRSIADITDKDVTLLRHMDQVSAEMVKAIFSTRMKVPHLSKHNSRTNNSVAEMEEEDKILDRILATDDVDDNKRAATNVENSESSSSSSFSTNKKDVATIPITDKDLLRDWLFRPRSPISHVHPVSCLRFMSGMHILPSLCPLHLHITSLDMQSDALRNKKHYNTFTTSFFVSRSRVEEEITKHRYVKMAVDRDSLHFAEQAENQSPMVCAWCQFQCKSAPELKEHLIKCYSNNCYFTQQKSILNYKNYMRRTNSLFFFRHTPITLLMQGEAVRRRQNIEFQSNRPSDFDIDKEQWGKQMQFASLECVIDNNIQPYSMWSIAGIRKNISGWMTMKKLTERRPNFKNDDLLQTFANYKMTANSLDLEKFKLLSRMTTFAEADRLSKEGTTELHARMKSSSWKTIAAASSRSAKHKQQQKLKEKQQQKTSNNNNTSKYVEENETNNDKNEDQKLNEPESKSSTKKGTGESSSSEPQLLFTGVAEPNMAGVDPYELQIIKFDIVNLWMGSMTSEDWIQLTARCEYREKNASIGPFANKMSLPQSSSAAAEALRMKTIHGNANTDKDGYTKVVEYPVFEVKLGDGITAANTQPFSIVCILDKDGSRYGKDGNDVSLLRKNFAQANKSKWGFGR